MIAAEDSKFVEHEGFDWDGIELAIEKNQKRGRHRRRRLDDHAAAREEPVPVRTAKSYCARARRRSSRVMLEAMLDKRRIFELYLNVIEWGNGVFGAEAAAQRYFGIPAARLSAEQAARLAAMAPNPRFYERNAGSRRGSTGRSHIILARMPAAELP